MNLPRPFESWNRAVPKLHWAGGPSIVRAIVSCRPWSPVSGDYKAAAVSAMPIPPDVAPIRSKKGLRPYRSVTTAAGMLSKSLARPKAATTVPYASLSNNNRSMTRGMAGLTTPTATPGNAQAHGDRPNFANSRCVGRRLLQSPAETSRCQCRHWWSLPLLVMAAATGPHAPVSGGPTMTKTTTMTTHHRSDVDADNDAFEEKSL